MSLGGFSGSDPILTTSQLASLVDNGTVRFFMVNSFGRGQIPTQILNQLPQQIRNVYKAGAVSDLVGLVVNKAQSLPG